MPLLDEAGEAGAVAPKDIRPVKVQPALGAGAAAAQAEAQVAMVPDWS